MKKTNSSIFPAHPVRMLTALFLACLCTGSGQAQQFNRIGYVVEIAQAYSPTAASALGGEANTQVDMLNACAGANIVQQNSGTGTYWHIAGFYMSANDPGNVNGSTTLSWLASNADAQDVRDFATSLGANLLDYVATDNDVSGIAYQPGYYSTLSYASGAWYVVFAHELGHNFGCPHADGLGAGGFRTIMLHNYCGGADISYYTNPSLYYNGIQLLGTVAQNCGTGSLLHNGNCAGIVALAGPGKNNAASFNALTNFNPLLTAVHCGGAAVGTTSADQRTFAADQNYSGGTAWSANGYNYTVDVSAVTNPAPQTVYQEQRYGNMTYTFTDYQPGTNYLVRLHFSECCWASAGKRVFNVFINGQKVLTNLDIYATAGANNKAVIKEVMAPADANGKLAVQFMTVTDNAFVNAIEILQGGLFVPLNLTPTPGNGQASLSWSPVVGATSYNVKRAMSSGGPYTTIGNTTDTNYTDNPLAGTTTYYYVVSAVNGGNESFDSLEASVTTPVTVNTDTWVGGSGNNFSTLANWLYSIGSGPVSNSDALVFDAVGSTTPNNNLSGLNVSTLTFNPGAQAFTISGNAFTLGTNSAGPVIAVNSANPQIINNNITLTGSAQSIATTGGNLKLGGILGGAASLTKLGAQTLTLSGNNSFTGATAVGGGTLAITAGSFAPTALFQVGNASGKAAVLNVSGGTLAANYNSGQFTSSLIVGGTSGSAGAVKLTSGAFSVNQQFALGAGSGGYGAFGMSGGLATVGSFMVVGFNNDKCVFNQSGGTFTINNNLMTIGAGGSGSAGVANLSGGTFNSIATTGYGPTIGGIFVGENGTGTLNVSGSALVNVSGWALRLGQNSGANGMVNLLGGTVSATAVSKGGGSGILNFNGGILKARTSNTSFLTGLTSANIYSGGATINDGGFAITVGQALLAPGGYGVGAIYLTNYGSGYIDTPVVTISGGSGSNAMAIAQIDYALGTVTNILITCPGVNYLSTDVLTITLSGGGGSGAGGEAVLTANVSGGLTKTGAGTLTLSSPNTYSGNTTISAGKLVLSGSGSMASSPAITVASGATFDVSAAAFSLGPVQTLQGNGTVNGAVTVNGTLSPGIGGIGTLTLNNSPVLNGTVLMKINRNGGTPLNDQIKLPSSAITYGGTLQVTNVGAALQSGDSFTLFTATSHAGSFTNIIGSPGDNLAYRFTNGVLSVISPVATNPTNLTFSVSGMNFTLSWPEDHTGWRLQSQTNSVGAGLGTNWVDVGDVTQTNRFSVPVVATNGSVFFRLVYP